MKSLKYILGFLLIAFIWSCEEPLEIDPNQSIDSAALIVDASSANVAMNGLYSNAQDFWRDRGYFNIDVLSDITDHVGTFTSLREFTENNVLPDNAELPQLWDAAYELIYNANIVLDVLPGVTDPALDANRTQFLGEARALRGYAYYYLANLWGDVPLVLSPVGSLEEVNRAASSQSDVFDQVAADLGMAVGEVASGGSAARITKGAVHAMLAKLHMTRGHWPLADASADAVMAEGYMLEPNYMDLFGAATSGEAIFELDFNSTDANSLSFWYWDKPGGRHEVAPSQAIIDAYEAGDTRRASVGDAVGGGESPFFVTKWSDFATGTDNPIVLRLADILLIKAEAQAEMGNFGVADGFINQVRTRAGLADVALDGGNFKDVILNERMIELAWEGGHRWFDMLRTGSAEDHVVANGQTACKALLPIPRAEIDANTLITQNPCY